MTMTREWAAIRVGDVVVASVRDIESKEICHPGREDYRPWAYSHIDEKGRANCKDNGKKDCGCRPGQPCPNAHTIAARYWDKWGTANVKRFWRARRYQPNGAVSTSDFGWEQEKYEDAIKDAVRLGFPFVCFYDGHYTELEKRPVYRAAEEPTLFPSSVPVVTPILASEFAPKQNQAGCGGRWEVCKGMRESGAYIQRTQLNPPLHKWHLCLDAELLEITHCPFCGKILS